MKMISRLIFFSAIVYVSQFVLVSTPSAELIEPTRSLEGKEIEAMGRLTVLSEPPGLKVYLDGKGLGKTPTFMLEVKPGIHTLRVKSSKTEFYLEPGKIIKISFFKNEFIEIPVETKASEKKPETVQPNLPSSPPTAQPSPQEVRAQENRDRAKERWMRYVDGSSPSF